MLLVRSITAGLILTIAFSLSSALAQPSARKSMGVMEVYRTRWSIQDRSVGLEQDLARTVIERANDWFTRENPNAPTARLDDRLLVEVLTEYSPTLGTTNTRLDKLVLGTIPIENSFENFLDAPTLSALIRRDCYWRDEVTTVINPSISPITPDMAAALSMPISVSERSTASRVSEWMPSDPWLQARLTSTLRRYYAILKQDSGRVRYIAANAGRIPFRLRAGRISSTDSSDQLISLTLGRLVIAPSNSVRVAIGDNLCEALLNSRGESAEGLSLYDADSRFGNRDWSSNVSLIASLDRVDYRVTPTMAAFVQMGAPESNLRWWNDGTFRAGISTQQFEAAVLLPMASGAQAVGPLQERLLMPAIGVAGSATLGRISASARVAFPSSGLISGSVAPTPYVHTIGAGATYRARMSGNLGEMYLDFGGGYERFVPHNADSAMATINRVSPTIKLAWIPNSELMRFELGTVDQSLVFAFATRISEHLYFELAATSTNIFRDAESFEHPFSIFLTPRVKF